MVLVVIIELEEHRLFKNPSEKNIITRGILSKTKLMKDSDTT